MVKRNDPDHYYCFERGATRTGAAHGWTDYMPDMPDTEILRPQLALNLER